jgi:protein-L-isoaspartate(D-aspartate) O-methyltransferase
MIQIKRPATRLRQAARMDTDVEGMLRTVAAHVSDTARETGCAALSPRIASAMREVPRDRFVPAPRRDLAFADTPLPIGHGQTISQPFIVALMTQLLGPQPGQRVLEVGSGCGYQAAVLARLVAEVFGMEIVVPLAERASRTLRELGIGNARIRAGDGYDGWPEEQPFDGILVTAAGSEVPPPLLKQLRVGGRLVMPVEEAVGWQTLVVVDRRAAEDFEQHRVLAVRFVPLRRRPIPS